MAHRGGEVTGPCRTVPPVVGAIFHRAMREHLRDLFKGKGRDQVIPGLPGIMLLESGHFASMISLDHLI